MDIVLERILSLIPKKENGKFVHGSLKNFANSIGLQSGTLISDWMAGRSKSYKNYVYEISIKHGVSVDWLLGKTEGKEKPAPILESDLTEKQREVLRLYDSASPATQAAILALLRAFEAERITQDELIKDE